MGGIDSILNFFDWIVEFFKNIGQVLNTVFEGLSLLLALLSRVLSFPGQISVFVPAFLFTSIWVVILVGCLKLIIGR